MYKLHKGGAVANKDHWLHADLLFSQIYDLKALNLWLPTKKRAVIISKPGTQITACDLYPVGELFTKYKRHYLYTMNCELHLNNLANYEPVHPGWFPLQFCLDVLAQVGVQGWTVTDPFMGRGTVGKAALQLGMHFIGVDKNPERVKLAEKYLAE